MTKKANTCTSWVGLPIRRSGRWSADSASFRVLAGVLLILFAVYAVIFLILTVHRLRQQAGGDFFALWSAARFASEHGAAQVYNAPILHNAQVAMGLNQDADYPFPYPPFFLLYLAPLAWLPYGAAYGVAMGGTLLLFIGATVGKNWWSAMVPGALLAPITTITWAAGQAGFLAAALLIGGLRLLGQRPVLAGALFGLATYKPQIGLLVPIALVAAKRWSAIAAAGVTAAVLVGAASLAYGLAIWPAWIAEAIRYADEFASAQARVSHLMPTVSAALIQLGAPKPLAMVTQLVAALVAVTTVWRCFRNGPTPLAAAALFVATFLATPHAFVYDMPPVTAAVLWLIAETRRTGAVLSTAEVCVMCGAMMSPIALVAGGSASPLVVLWLALLLGLIARRCLAASLPRPIPAAESP